LAPENGVVLDPFMGSGTTLVEGLTRPGTTIGFDIDPLARMIARAKTDRISAERIEALATELAMRWRGPATRLTPPMPDLRDFGHWFTADAWGWLQSLLAAIHSLDCTAEERRFMLVVFSSDQSQKTYVSGTLTKTPPDVQSTFWRSATRAVNGVRELGEAAHPGAVVQIPDAGNACAMPLDAASVDLIVTSPPYLDSVDYMYNFMLEYFWLGPLLGVPTRSAFNRLRQQPVGAKKPMTGLQLPKSLAELVSLEHFPSARRAAAATYFGMMQKHLSEAARCLKPGGRYALVVGNSQSRKDVVPIHTALVHLAAEAGLQVEKVFGYRIRRHYMKFPRAGRGGIILIDWVIILKSVAAGATDALRELPLRWVTLDPDAVAH
jgi:DNA modification methylase